MSTRILLKLIILGRASQLVQQATEVVVESREPLATNISYFCPECGNIWAFAEDYDGPRRYYAYHVPCPKHPFPEYAYADLPGDLFLPFESHYNDAIRPFAVMLLNYLWALEEPIHFSFVGTTTGRIQNVTASSTSSPQNAPRRLDWKWQDPLPPDGPRG